MLPFPLLGSAYGALQIFSGPIMVSGSINSLLLMLYYRAVSVMSMGDGQY